MKIRPLGAELFHVDGRTDVTTLILMCLKTNCTQKVTIYIYIYDFSSYTLYYFNSNFYIHYGFVRF